MSKGVDARHKAGHDVWVVTSVKGALQRITQSTSWPGLSRPSTRILAGHATPPHTRIMLEAWIYMMTNRPNGVLYLGVTADLIRRVWQHREGLVEGFTKRYGLTRLVYVERHPDIGSAIRREMTMKHWPRTWKVRLILRDNPEWTDLYDQLL